MELSILEKTCSVVSMVGFPIVAYLLLFFRMDKTIKEMTKAIDRLSNVLGDDGRICRK